MKQSINNVLKRLKNHTDSCSHLQEELNHVSAETRGIRTEEKRSFDACPVQNIDKVGTGMACAVSRVGRCRSHWTRTHKRRDRHPEN